MVLKPHLRMPLYPLSAGARRPGFQVWLFSDEQEPVILSGMNIHFSPGCPHPRRPWLSPCGSPPAPDACAVAEAREGHPRPSPQGREELAGVYLLLAKHI